MNIKHCLPNQKPSTNFVPVCNFGFPKGNTGRCGTALQGILIHCSRKSLSEVIANGNRKVVLPKAFPETSLHYYIDTTGKVTQMVEDANIAWAFPAQMASPNPLYTNFAWQLVTANPNIPLDRYLLHIGIQSNPEIPSDCVECAVYYNQKQLQTLAELVAYLTETYGIILSRDFVNVHSAVDGAAEGECDCFDICDLFDRVNCLCRECEHPHDSRYKAGEIVNLYGTDKYGCIVSEPLEKALQRLGVI